MFRGPEYFPPELQSLTGVGKEKLIGLRMLVQLELVHTDDRWRTAVPLRDQLWPLNVLARKTLGTRTDNHERIGDTE